MEGANATFDIAKEFRTFQVRQRTLADILSEAATVTEALNMSKEKELSELSEKIKRDTFKVMVTGTFKNGKSTFINSLLGEEVLPAYALPCTAVINEVQYGTEKRAKLYFRNPLPAPLPKNLAPKARQHMSRYKGKPIPPLDIPYDEIEDYVVIPMDEDPKEMKLQSPYAKVELFYPLELLKSGVEIIDSPGLNEDETRTRVTMEYLNRVDAILYVLDANKIASGDEMKFVENDLRGNEFEHVIFVVNRIDQIRERERPQIHKYAFMKLQAFYPNPSLYSISALNALDGKLDGEADKVRSSGMPELEQRLTDFLTREKGKAKLVQPAKRLRQILSREALEQVIPKERNLLATSLEDLEKCSKEIEPKLKLLQQEKDSKRHKLSSKIARSGKRFERMARTNMSELMKSIPSWVDGFQPQTNLGFLPSKKKTEAVLSEMTDFLKEKLDESQRHWKTEILQPEMESAFQDIFESAEKDFSQIFEEIDQINMTLSGGETYNANPVPFWQRVAGVAGGLMIGDIGLAASGGINGIGKEFVTTIAVEIGAGVLLGLLGLFNPFTIGAVLIAVFLGNLGAGSARALEKLKAAFCQNVMDEIAKNADSQSEELADSIEDKLNGLADQIVTAVSNEIKDLQSQLDAAMEEKRRGEANVQKRRKELDTVEKKIHELNKRLDDLTFELASQ